MIAAFFPPPSRERRKRLKKQGSHARNEEEKKNTATTKAADRSPTKKETGFAFVLCEKKNLFSFRDRDIHHFGGLLLNKHAHCGFANSAKKGKEKKSSCACIGRLLSEISSFNNKNAPSAEAKVSQE